MEEEVASSSAGGLRLLDMFSVGVYVSEVCRFTALWVDKILQDLMSLPVLLSKRYQVLKFCGSHMQPLSTRELARTSKPLKVKTGEVHTRFSEGDGGQTDAVVSCCCHRCWLLSCSCTCPPL